MCVIFECSADTIRRRVETLVNTGDIDETQNCVSPTNVQAFGYNTTTLYDLTVFNQLAMVCIDNEKARRIQSVSDMTQIKIDDENGRGPETTIYNLNAQIVWACFYGDAKKVVDVQSHSDYIVPCTTHQAHAGLRSCWHP